MLTQVARVRACSQESLIGDMFLSDPFAAHYSDDWKHHFFVQCRKSLGMSRRLNSYVDCCPTYDVTLDALLRRIGLLISISVVFSFTICCAKLLQISSERDSTKRENVISFPARC